MEIHIGANHIIFGGGLFCKKIPCNQVLVKINSAATGERKKISCIIFRRKKCCCSKKILLVICIKKNSCTLWNMKIKILLTNPASPKDQMVDPLQEVFLGIFVLFPLKCLRNLSSFVAAWLLILEVATVSGY